jgi:hypothetical protein
MAQAGRRSQAAVGTGTHPRQCSGTPHRHEGLDAADAALHRVQSARGRTRCAARRATIPQLEPTEFPMAKGQQQKKETKKQPQKSLKEKRAEKQAKKAMKG